MRTLRITILALLALVLTIGRTATADDPAPEPPEATAPSEAAADSPQPAETDAQAASTETPPAAEQPEGDNPGAQPGEKKPTAEELSSDGRDALFTGQYAKAIELLAKAVAADQTKTSYRMDLARAYRYAGQDDKAVEQLDAILDAAPDHVEAGQALAEIHSQAKRWEKVVAVLEPLLKYRHDYPTYHRLAEAQYNLGKLEDARKNYEEAVKLNPQSAPDHYQLGNIYLSGNFFALAADSYQTALRLGLDSPVLRYKLGSAYFNLRNYFGQIVNQTVKSGEAGTIHDRWYLIEPVPGQKDVFRCAPESSAIYQIARAVADGIEDRPDIRVLRATIYLNARRYRQAYEMFGKIGDDVPEEDKALLHYYHAQAAFGTGQFDRYIELLKEAIELDPAAYQSALVAAYTEVADQYNQAGELDKYIEFLAKAVAESPQTATLHLKLGNAYHENRQHAEAIAQWQMVLDLEPGHPERMRLLNLIERSRIGVSQADTPNRESRSTEGGGAPANQ